MGMPISLLARGPEAHGSAAAKAAALVFAELRGVDALFSTYQPDSEVSRVRRGETVPTSDDVLEVLRRCEQARELTGGLFDATAPDGLWDPSGLVKGWAAERAARHLVAAGGDWVLNAGGDVVVHAPGGDTFGVGIEDPLQAGRIAAVVRLASGAVATSGAAARGAHVYDPRTGGPAGTVASVTVVGPSLEIADVLATAGFVAGAGARDLVAAVPSYEALVIGLDGEQHGTGGWDTLLP